VLLANDPAHHTTASIRGWAKPWWTLFLYEFRTTPDTSRGDLMTSRGEVFSSPLSGSPCPEELLSLARLEPTAATPLPSTADYRPTSGWSFLGDAVPGPDLHRRSLLPPSFPDRSEGDLAKLPCPVSSTHWRSGRRLGEDVPKGGLGRHLLLGVGEANTGPGADKSIILATAWNRCWARILPAPRKSRPSA